VPRLFKNEGYAIHLIFFGVPARNSLVQKERGAVCEVIQSYLGFTTSILLFPFL